MSPNILITGAAGYIGGTLVTQLVSLSRASINANNITVLIRTEGQAQALADLAVNAVQVDLADDKAVIEAVLRHEIDIVVHTASSVDPRLVVSLTEVLGQRRRITGEETFFIHSSGTSAFAKESGWTFGKVADVDSIYDEERKLVKQPPSHPVRECNVLAIEKAKAQGVTSFVVVVPMVYGRGSGPGKKLSQNLPALVKASKKNKTLHKYDFDTIIPLAHVSDVAMYFIRLLQKILNKDQLPSGEDGYYFAVAHESTWFKVSDRMAEALYARGLVKDPKPQIWPSDEMAAESLGFPVQWVRQIANNGEEVVPVRKNLLGWEPVWDEEKFLQSMDDEILATEELDTSGSSLFDKLFSTDAKA